MSVATSTKQPTVLPLSVNQSSLTLVPCQPVTGSTCQLCVDAENVHPLGNQLIGCPVIKDKCGSMVVRHELDCTVLATSDVLQCTPSSDLSTDWNSTSKIVLISLVSVLALSIAAFGGHFAFRRYQEWQQSQSFQIVPGDEMEAVPLGQDTEDK